MLAAEFNHQIFMLNNIFVCIFLWRHCCIFCLNRWKISHFLCQHSNCIEENCSQNIITISQLLYYIILSVVVILRISLYIVICPLLWIAATYDFCVTWVCICNTCWKPAGELHSVLLYSMSNLIVWGIIQWHKEFQFQFIAG